MADSPADRIASIPETLLEAGTAVVALSLRRGGPAGPEHNELSERGVADFRSRRARMATSRVDIGTAIVYDGQRCYRGPEPDGKWEVVWSGHAEEGINYRSPLWLLSGLTLANTEPVTGAPGEHDGVPVTRLRFPVIETGQRKKTGAGRGRNERLEVPVELWLDDSGLPRLIAAHKPPIALPRLVPRFIRQGFEDAQGSPSDPPWVTLEYSEFGTPTVIDLPPSELTKPFPDVRALVRPTMLLQALIGAAMFRREQRRRHRSHEQQHP